MLPSCASSAPACTLQYALYMYHDWLFLRCLCGASAQCPSLLFSVYRATPASSLFSTFHPQALVKFGSEEERTAVFDELRPHILELARNTYGHFIVLRMLDRANKEQLQQIMNALHGQVVSLLRHPSGSAGEEVPRLDARLASEIAYARSWYRARRFPLVNFYIWLSGNPRVKL